MVGIEQRSIKGDEQSHRRLTPRRSIFSGEASIVLDVHNVMRDGDCLPQTTILGLGTFDRLPDLDTIIWSENVLVGLQIVLLFEETI